MSPLTIFLAKLLRLYCIIVALAMMTRKQTAVATIKALVANLPLRRCRKTSISPSS